MRNTTRRGAISSDVGPFAIVPEWLLLRSDISGNAIKLYAILGRHADDSGAAYPSKNRLAGILGCSEATVERLLRELADAGALTVTPRYRSDGGRSTNLYTVVRIEPTELSGAGVTGEPGEGSLVSRGTGHGGAGKEREPLNESHENERIVPAAPVEREYDPIRGRKVDGRDLPWDALAEVIETVEAPNGARMAGAVRTIRTVTWEFVQRKWLDAAERASGDPDGYELMVAATIREAARWLHNDSPGLTYGPEGIARHFKRALLGMERPSSTAAIVDEVLGGRQ